MKKSVVYHEIIELKNEVKDLKELIIELKDSIKRIENIHGDCNYKLDSDEN